MQIGTMVLGALGQSACAISPNYSWWKDGVSPEQMALDQSQCEFESVSRTPPA